VKRIVVFFFVCLAFVSGISEVKIADIQPSADVYEAVKRVVEAGVMSLDEKNRFLGTLLVTRYDLARSLANFMGYLESRVRVEEISKTLSNVTTRIKVIEAFANVTQTEIENIKGDLDMLKSVQNSMSTELTEKMDTFTAGVNAKVEALESRFFQALDEINARLDLQDSEIVALKAELNGVKKSVEMVNDTLSSSLTRLSVDVKANRMALESFKQEVSAVRKTLNDAITAFPSQIDRVKEEFREQLDTMTESLKASQTSLKKELKTSFLEVEALLATTREDIVSATTELAALEASVTKVTQSSSEAISKNTQEIRKLDLELRDQRSQQVLNDLTATLRKTEMDLMTIQAKLKELDSVKNELSSTVRVTEDLTDRINSLEKRTNKIENEVAKTSEKVKSVSTQSLALTGASAFLGILLGALLAWFALSSVP